MHTSASASPYIISSTVLLLSFERLYLYAGDSRLSV